MLNVRVARIGLLLIEVTLIEMIPYPALYVPTFQNMKPKKKNAHKLCLSGPWTEPFYHGTLIAIITHKLYLLQHFSTIH